MTSFKRKAFDRAHRKGFYQPKRDRDGNLVLRYGKQTKLVMERIADEFADDAELFDMFSLKREG